MKTPIFAHGKMENVQYAIENNKISYPAYIWIDDYDEYAFLNKDGELEICGIPKLVGSQDDVVILSSLNDGLYQIMGRHMITAEHDTTFYTSSYILVIIQTIDNVKKIRRITADELTTYTVNEDLSITTNEVATKDYLLEHKYATEEYVDEKVATLKMQIENEIEEIVTPIIEPLVYEIINEEIQQVANSDIEALFN